MNAQIFIRNVKLAKLGMGELNRNEEKLYKFLMDNLYGLNTYITDEHPDKLYFGKDKGQIILSYSLKNEWLWVKYSDIWSFLAMFYLWIRLI